MDERQQLIAQYLKKESDYNEQMNKTRAGNN